VHVGRPLVAHQQTLEAVQPGEGALHNPEQRTARGLRGRGATPCYRSRICRELCRRRSWRDQLKPVLSRRAANTHWARGRPILKEAMAGPSLDHVASQVAALDRPVTQ